LLLQQRWQELMCIRILPVVQHAWWSTAKEEASWLQCTTWAMAWNQSWCSVAYCCWWMSHPSVCRGRTFRLAHCCNHPLTVHSIHTSEWSSEDQFALYQGSLQSEALLAVLPWVASMRSRWPVQNWNDIVKLEQWDWRFQSSISAINLYTVSCLYVKTKLRQEFVHLNRGSKRHNTIT
jgi:hypothetical protein